VRYERDRAAAVVTIDRPQASNAIDPSTAERLEAALERFEQETDARVLILCGAGGRSFSAGADLKQIDGFAARLEAPGGPLGLTHRTTTKVTIAAIGGWCLAGGLELAAWCDLRIADVGSWFGCSERRFGVPLVDGGTQRLVRLVGLGRALELIITGRLIDAQTALGWGLINEVTPAGQHLQRALELAEQIASFPQRTLLADRAAALAAADLPLAQGLAFELAGGRAVYEDAVAGAGRFAAGEGRGAAGLERFGSNEEEDG